MRPRLPSVTGLSRQCSASSYRRLVLDGVGHFPQRQAGEQVAGEIVRFFQQNG